MEENKKAPLGTYPIKDAVITITEEDYNTLMFTQKLFFEFSNMFKKSFVETMDTLTSKRLNEGTLKLFYEDDLVDVIKEDGTKVKELRKDFFEEIPTQVS